MGGNFINSVLEALGQRWSELLDHQVEITMCILSNYTPDCLVHAQVHCPVDQSWETTVESSLPANLKVLWTWPRVDPYRATTHNKGIFNGVDAVVHRHRQRLPRRGGLWARLRSYKPPGRRGRRLPGAHLLPLGQ